MRGMTRRPGCSPLREKCAGLAGFGTVALGQPTVVAPYARPARHRAVPRADVVRCLDTDAVRGAALT